MERRAEDARLRALLKQFDPVEGDEGLAPAERARMRRSLVEAAGAARAPRALRLAPVLAACALILVVLWLALPSRRGAGTAEPPPATSHGDATPPVIANEVPRSYEPDAIERRGATHAVANARPESARETLASPPDSTPRSIRYVTASGTQIIWTLDPQLEI